MVRYFARLAALATVLVVGAIADSNAQGGFDIRGSWHAETYLLKDGTRHPVRGLIFFTRNDWTVLFFVTPEGQGPQRGSAEGGTYMIDGSRLVFTHLYNLSTGKAVAGLPASPLRMEVKDAAAASTEPCTVDLDGDHLTLNFPSGNVMTFTRSAR